MFHYLRLLSVNMLKTARDYLNCHYVPAKNTDYNICTKCKKLIADINNNKEKQTENKFCYCFNNNNLIETKNNNKLNNNDENLINNNKYQEKFSTFELDRKMLNYFKVPSLLWYLIIPPALALTFVKYFIFIYFLLL